MLYGFVEGPARFKPASVTRSTNVVVEDTIAKTFYLITLHFHDLSPHGAVAHSPAECPTMLADSGFVHFVDRDSVKFTPTTRKSGIVVANTLIQLLTFASALIQRTFDGFRPTKTDSDSPGYTRLTTSYD